MTRKQTEATEEIKEEADYVNAAQCSVGKTTATSGQKCRLVTQSVPPMAVCWVILLTIMALRIYFSSVMSENNAKLTAENQQLKTQNQEMKKRNQELETQKNNLTETIQDMETKWNEQNVSRAQWSINAYCLVNEGRQCQPCQKGRTHDQSSCYGINNADAADLKTWDEAQANCTGKNSDLVVIVNEAEKTFISENSWKKGRLDEYWIGLRAENGKWKWVDGSDLTESSWIQQQATDGLCAVSVYEGGLKSASCGGKKRWICKKKALTIETEQ